MKSISIAYLLGKVFEKEIAVELVQTHYFDSLLLNLPTGPLRKSINVQLKIDIYKTHTT